MARMIVPQEDEQELGMAQSQNVELQLARQLELHVLRLCHAELLLVLLGHNHSRHRDTLILQAYPLPAEISSGQFSQSTQPSLWEIEWSFWQNSQR